MSRKTKRWKIPWRWWRWFAAVSALTPLAGIMAAYLKAPFAERLAFVGFMLFNWGVLGTILIDADRGFDQSPILDNVFHIYDDD